MASPSPEEAKSVFRRYTRPSGSRSSACPSIFTIREDANTFSLIVLPLSETGQSAQT
jgi:hypothetical protein